MITKIWPNEIICNFSLDDNSRKKTDEFDCCRWIADDLGIPSFARLDELTVVPVDAFDKRFGIWTIDCNLSPGCGGPPLPEEVIL